MVVPTAAWPNWKTNRLHEGLALTYTIERKNSKCLKGDNDAFELLWWPEFVPQIVDLPTDPATMKVSVLHWVCIVTCDPAVEKLPPILKKMLKQGIRKSHFFVCVPDLANFFHHPKVIFYSCVHVNGYFWWRGVWFDNHWHDFLQKSYTWTENNNFFTPILQPYVQNFSGLTLFLSKSFANP